MAAGRPSDFTAEIAERVIAELEEGRSLRAICLADDMPTARTVHNWLNNHDEFFQQYKRAREIQADTIFDECLDIADSQEGDIITKDGEDIVNHDVIARAKLRIDTRKWMAGKLKPKSYGDKVAIGGDGDMDPIKVESASDIEIARQVAFLLAKGVNGE